MAEWLERSPFQSGFLAPAAPQIASKTLLASFAALEQAHDVALRSVGDRKAELAGLQEQVDAPARANQKLELNLRQEQNKNSSLQNLLHQTRETAYDDKRRMTAELDALSHNNPHLWKQLDAEADKSRMLQGGLEAARKHGAEVESAIEGIE